MERKQLSGSVQKQHYVKSKTSEGTNVRQHTTRPPTLSDMPTSAMKSSRESAKHARVSKRYKGWGQTIHGFEGKCSCHVLL